MFKENVSISPFKATRIIEISYKQAAQIWIKGKKEVYCLKENGEHVACKGEDFKIMVDHFLEGGKFGMNDFTEAFKNKYSNK